MNPFLAGSDEDVLVCHLGALVVVVCTSPDNIPRKFDLVVNREALARPYLAMRLAGVDGAGWLAVVGSRAEWGYADSGPGGGRGWPRRIDVQLLDDSGRAIRQSLAPVAALSAVRIPALAEAIPSLVIRILERGPGLFPTWHSATRRALLALLKADSSSCVAGLSRIEGRFLTGWAHDLRDPDNPVRLAFRINDLPAGTAIADDAADDRAPLAAAAQGFSVALRPDVFAEADGSLAFLDVLLESTGETLLGGIPIRYGASEDWQAFARLDRQCERWREMTPIIRRTIGYAIQDYDLWFERSWPLERQALRGCARDAHSLGERAPIAVVVPLRAGQALDIFREVLDSIRGQSCPASLILVVNLDQLDVAFEALVAGFRAEGIACGWIDARDRATGPLWLEIARQSQGHHCLILDTDQLLAEDALAVLGAAIDRSGAGVLQGDEDGIDPGGRHCDPIFRGVFDPDLLLSNPYPGPVAVRAELLAIHATGLADATPDCWLVEMVLELAAAELREARAGGEGARWMHVPALIAHRRVMPGLSDTADCGRSAVLSNLRGEVEKILRRHLARQGKGPGVEVTSDLRSSAPQTRSPDHPIRLRDIQMQLQWPLPRRSPLVSIIIPTRNGGEMLRRCLDGLLRRTAYDRLEILVVDNGSDDGLTRDLLAAAQWHGQIRLLEHPGDFNWSAINNEAAAAARGDMLCFLNDDTEVIESGWLRELVRQANRSDVGAAGPKLLFADGTVQHGGIVTGARGVADHAFTGLAGNEAGYRMLAGVTRGVSAVTGACLVCRHSVFTAAGGFDSENLPVAYNDVDFCLRLRTLGLRIIWTPHARLRHYGSQSLGRELGPAQAAARAKETAYMQSRWPEALASDPFHSPHFEPFAPPYTLLRGSLRDETGSVSWLLTKTPSTLPVGETT